MDTSTITASEIMTRQLARTQADVHVLDAVDRLITSHVSGLPVVAAGDQFVGRFSERNAIAALGLMDVREEASQIHPLHLLLAADIMNRCTLTLSSDMDVFEAVDILAMRRASGAPVLDSDGRLLGVFSEKSAMKIYVGLCWEQLPSSGIMAWVDRDEERMVEEGTPLSDILERFQNYAFRRVLVVRDGFLIGQVTRRDALQAALVCNRTPLKASHTTGGAEQLGIRTNVESWMETNLLSISEAVDVLTVAQKFYQTSARQLPVVESGRLIGQVSRSDLLRAVQRHFPKPTPSHEASPLYLSSTERSSVQAVVS